MASDGSSVPPKPQSLTGRVAIVTGATRGIGKSIALELAARGCSVIGTYVSPKSAELASALVSQVAALRNSAVFTGLRADLKSTDTPALIASTLTTYFPGKHLDILVFNAAEVTLGPLSSLTAESVNTAFATNLTTPILIVQALLPHFSRTGSGRIINITSESARVGRANSTVYTANKAALEGMTRVWAKELGQEYNGLTCNAVSPGIVETELMDLLPKARIDAWIERRKENAVGQRAGKPEEVAACVAWLASDESSWVSGVVVPVNGGSSFY